MKLPHLIPDIIPHHQENGDSANSAGTETPKSVPSAGDIEAQAEQIINNLLGNKATITEKAALHAIGSLISTAIGLLLPLLKNRINADSLKSGLFAFLNGVLEEEAGLKEIIDGLKKNS